MYMNKTELRKHVKELKKTLSPETKDKEAHIVFETIEQLPCFARAGNILFYYSMPDELPTHLYVEKWTKTKHIFLPKVNGDVLDILPFKSNELSSNGVYQIMEPVGTQPVDPTIIDLVIVPAVALDSCCNRLGRGRGYYDRLLPQCTNAYTLGVALDCQYFEHLPVEQHDQKLCGVLTSSHSAFVRQSPSKEIK